MEDRIFKIAATITFAGLIIMFGYASSHSVSVEEWMNVPTVRVSSPVSP